MTEKHVPLHKKGAKGFSDAMANAINAKQAHRVQKKMNTTKMHPPRAKQGYTPQRSSVDISTL